MTAGSQGTRHTDEDVVEFGPFRLDRARRLLTRERASVPLGGRAFEILLVLVRHAPEVVGKATLFQQVWPGTFIEESTLRYHLSTLRKALGDGKDGSRYISTASGIGYCFVAPLSYPLTVETGQPGARSDVAGAVRPPDTNLPLRVTEIVGREHELAELGDWLTRSRLVTLVGPGGVGKTRLAVELGWRMQGDFAAGVWLIDLAPLNDQDAVASTAAATLGVSVTKTGATVDSIIAALGKTRPLLIFDNCEHLAEAAAALIKTLLERAPGVSILATSQKSFQLAAERVYDLDPLEVPLAGAVEVRGFAAVELFARRGRAADRLFALTEDNGAAVGEICRQLDGLPLALEMAAGRLRMLGVEGLLRGLGDRLTLLKGTAESGVRHGSLHGMLAWSHSLLAPFDQRVFRRLAALPGGFSLEAAVAVAGENDGERWAVVDALGRLIDQSLVTLERGEPARYRLLETLRLYAVDKLWEAGEAEVMAERHARHFVTVFDEADACWEATPDPDWLARYQPELGHLRAALDWALAAPERRQIALALAASGCLLFRWLGLLGEGLRYLDRLIPLLDAEIPPARAARLLHHASVFCMFTDDPRGLSFAERSATLCREGNDRPALANALATIAQYRMREERFAEAEELLLEARQLLAGSTQKKSRLRLTAITGNFHYQTHDIANGKRYLSEALELARALKSNLETSLLSSLGAFEEASGDIDRAIGLMREALSRARAQLGGDRTGMFLTNLGSALILRGDVCEARSALEEALSVLIERGNFSAEFCLRQWAALSAVEGRLAEAAQLVGFTDAERERSGRALMYSELPIHKRLLALLEAGLQPAEYEAWKSEGAPWSEAEAIDFVASRLIHRPAS